MSTALPHHYSRSHVIAAAAAIAAVAALGVVLEVSNDNATSNEPPGTTTAVHHFRLTGGSNEQGNWNHAGTTSGGHQPTELPF